MARHTAPNILLPYIPVHKYMIIALHTSTKYCLEVTASAIVECFMGCPVRSAPQGSR